MSSIPTTFESDLDLAVSSIGQGQVQATPLAMASASQAIAEGGVRSPTAIVKDPELAGDYPTVKVMSPQTADEMKQMMIAVVNSGTGAAGAVAGVQVAGKTGTAELGTSSGPPPAEGEDPELDVDAWFTAFAPADKPKLAVAVEVFNAPATAARWPPRSPRRSCRPGCRGRPFAGVACRGARRRAGAGLGRRGAESGVISWSGSRTLPRPRPLPRRSR